MESEADQMISGPTTTIEPHNEIVRQVLREDRSLFEALQWAFARRGMDEITIRFTDLQRIQSVHALEMKRFAK